MSPTQDRWAAWMGKAKPGPRAVEAIALVAILGLAGWLRLTGLDRASLFGDEAVYSGQAAAIAGDPARAEGFGIFLAHPVLFQILLGGGFAAGVAEEGGRILTGLFGVATVCVAWVIGRSIGGRALGLAAALILGLLAYHAYLSRLVLLDGPAVFFVGCSLYGFLRAAKAGSSRWLAVAAWFLGLAVLTKETALLVLPAVALSAALEPRLRLSARSWLFAAASFVAVVAAFPISILVGGGAGSSLQYLRYQLGRTDQSSPLTYVDLVDPYVGWALIALVVAGLVMALRRGGGRRIVAIWALVPAAFLQGWGLRELQLPMIVVIQLALLASIGIEGIAGSVSAALARRKAWREHVTHARAALGVGLLLATAWTLTPLTLRATSLPDGRPVQSGLREAATWIRDHAGPTDGVFVSTAYKSSVIAYYARRPAYGFGAARRRDPVYRDPGDVEAFWRAGGIRWVVLDRQSRSRAAAADDESAPYDRLTRLLDTHPHELVHVVPGPTADAWLAQVYRLTEVEDRTVPVPEVVGRGDGRVVVLSYGLCIAIGLAIALRADRRTG